MKTSARRARLAVTVAVVAVGFAGCGGDDERTPEATIEELYAAIADADYETVCSLADESAQQALIDQSDGAESCEEAAPEVFDEDQAAAFGDVEIGEVVVEDDKATATVTSSEFETSDEVVLILEDGEWKVTGE